jgi:alkanesulfonate monooxygenase SsuD/methylene tetrahydromethanopterin reductase-like flavin-dependent oxidoreductase (luciferase family)
VVVVDDRASPVGERRLHDGVIGLAAEMIKLGIDVHDAVLEAPAERRRALLARAAAGGLDHVCVGDHVSFHDGTGFDGMVSAATALASHDQIDVWIAVYQLALRHPLVVARQLASLSQVGGGRIVLGVGAGGEDRREVSNCGIDPATRGQRLDECLEVLDLLGSGEPVNHAGRFFTLEQARIDPPPHPRIPVVVGGNSDAAIRRTATFADGWLGIFLSARRYQETVGRVREAAAAVGRKVDWFGLQVWCGLDPRRGVGRKLLSEKMQSLYRLPYERFEHFAPTGSAQEIATWLLPFVAAGARHITLLPAAYEWEAGVDQAIEVKEHLADQLGATAAL